MTYKNKCQYCKKEIIGKNWRTFAAHITNCKKNPNHRLKINKIRMKATKKQLYPILCIECNKLFWIYVTPNKIKKGSHRQHCSNKCATAKTRTDKMNKQRSKKMKGKRIGNAKLSYLGIEERKCIICGSHFKIRVSRKKKTCSKKCYKKLLSLRAIERGSGGYRNYGGNSSGCYYKTTSGKKVYLQSSFELILAKDLDKNKIKWDRPNYIPYKDKKGKKRKYYPDFHLIEYGVYLDPKNKYLKKKDKEKIDMVKNQNNVKILVLDREQLEWSIIKKLMGY